MCIILPGTGPVLLLVIRNTAGQTVNSCNLTSVIEGHLTDNQRDLISGCLGTTVIRFHTPCTTGALSIAAIWNTSFSISKG